ncbi:hypothetical protein [Hoyosella altamirensis]|uniref:Uncharacterized protein n=1 Tax=Hoyosella altamirensis TaxID=616997 RepID=A0A839RIB0_9ACTN|nr:hypothetical protein [Hoyosella altamirensis]MBB3036160.1 hypothetical protein [Hoyosella altamirensis]
MKRTTIRRPAVRPAIAIAAAGALAVAAPIAAQAKPFDTPPNPVFCSGGIAAPHSYVQADDNNLPPELIAYVINERGGPGAMVSWLNLSQLETGNLLFGTEDLEPTELDEDFVRPITLVETGAGTVVSAMYGLYENARGELCLLLPGVTTDQVPSAPAAQTAP